MENLAVPMINGDFSVVGGMSKTLRWTLWFQPKVKSVNGRRVRCITRRFSIVRDCKCSLGPLRPSTADNGALLPKLLLSYTVNPTDDIPSDNMVRGSISVVGEIGLLCEKVTSTTIVPCWFSWPQKTRMWYRTTFE